MQTKFNEAGRSMVEMLGVLAVIGVLSVAGILGINLP
jgi:Tfp pilus assembly protein FimT